MEGGSKNKGARRRNNGGDGGEKEWGFDAGENVKKTAAAATAAEVTVAVAPELWEAAEEETRSHRATARAQTSGRREARAACCSCCEGGGGRGRARAWGSGGGGGAKKPPRGLGPQGVGKLEQLAAGAATAAEVIAAEESQGERASGQSQRLGEPRASANSGTSFDHELMADIL